MVIVSAFPGAGVSGKRALVGKRKVFMVKFVVTVFEAMMILALAWIVLRSHRERFLNRSFAAFLLFLSLWVLCGFPQLLVSDPSDHYLTLVFRMAHFAASLATGTFLLFGLAFLRGDRPHRGWRLSTYAAMAAMAFCSLTDLVIRSAGQDAAGYHVESGPLYGLFVAYMVFFGFGGLFAIALKRSRSSSTDRARASYILLGFGLFLALALLLVVALPEIMGRDVTSDYTFFLAVVPIALTAYAILRHRLLDVRLAVRRSFAYLLTLLLFGAPLLALYLAFRFSLSSYPDLEFAASVIMLALAVAFSPAALRFSNRLAARILFSGLYDEVDLLHEVSVIFTSTANIRDGLVSATGLVCSRLGLSKLLVAIPDGTTRGKGNWVIGSTFAEGKSMGYHDMEAADSVLFQLWETLQLEDEGPRGMGDPAAVRARMEMGANGLAACVPVKGPTGKLAVLLVGKKVNRLALDPMDLDLLAQFAERAGIFIENYLLSSYLLSQFEELSETRRRLEESDNFKTEIINVTSHELRTPLTVLNGYTLMLHDHYERFSDEERKRYLEYIASSCQRLNDILDQFLTVSYFQRGTARATSKPTDLESLFEEIKSAFMPDQSKRIESEVRPSHLTVLTDRSYLLLLLNNLVENALRFSPEDKPVLMRAERSEGEVHISVRDYGRGLESGDVQYIFQPFTRLEETDKHRIGTGLGLYIVRLVSDLLGIKVDVESQPDSGTTFRLRLPLSRPQAGAR